MSVINWGSVMVIFISLPYSPVELSTCLNMCVCVGKPNAIEFAAISSLQHQLPSQSRLPGHCSSQGKYPMDTFALSRLIQYWIYTQLTVFACSLSVLLCRVGWLRLKQLLYWALWPVLPNAIIYPTMGNHHQKKNVPCFADEYGFDKRHSCTAHDHFC